MAGGFLATVLSFFSFLAACLVYQRRSAIRKTDSCELPPRSGYFKVVGSFTQIALVGSSVALFINITVVSMTKSRLKSLQGANESLQLNWGNLVCSSPIRRPAWVN
jgi:hypothetical protein